jgi:hypothetical protein
MSQLGSQRLMEMNVIVGPRLIRESALIPSY